MYLSCQDDLQVQQLDGQATGIFVDRLLYWRLTFLGLAKVGFRSTNVQISTNVDRSTNVQPSTKAPLLPNPCCAFVFYFSVSNLCFNVSNSCLIIVSIFALFAPSQ